MAVASVIVAVVEEFFLRAAVDATFADNLSPSNFALLLLVLFLLRVGLLPLMLLVRQCPCTGHTVVIIVVVVLMEVSAVVLGPREGVAVVGRLRGRIGACV